MKQSVRLGALTVLLAGLLVSQTRKIVVAAGCVLPFSLTAVATVALPDNSGPQCINWTIGYAASGFTGLTLSVQEAPDKAIRPALSSIGPAQS